MSKANARQRPLRSRTRPLAAANPNASADAVARAVTRAVRDELLAPGVTGGGGGLFPHGVNKIEIKIGIENLFTVGILIEGPASERPQASS